MVVLGRHFEIAALATIAAGGALLFFLASAGERPVGGVSRVEYLQNRAQLVATSGVYLLCLNDQTYDFLIAYEQRQEPESLERLHVDLKEMERVSASLRKQLDTGKARAILSTYESVQQQLVRSSERFVALVRDGQAVRTAEQLGRLSLEKEAVAATVHALLNESNRHLQSVVAEAKADEARTKWSLIGRALTLSFVLWLLLKIRWSVLKPLRQLTEAAERISGGDLSASPAILVRHGQLGKLVGAFERMRNRITQTNQNLELRIAQRTCQLQQNQERLELAIAASEAGLWDWEPQRNRVTYNASWAKILGYEYGEPSSDGKSFYAHVHPDDLSLVRARIEEHLDGRSEYYESEHRVRRKFGGWCWVSEHGRVVDRDEHGQPFRVIGLMRDITSRRIAEGELRASRLELQKRSVDLAASNRELKRTNEEMTQFVYTVSHDLKTPLVTMKGFVGVLKEELADLEGVSVTDSIRRIERAATHMGRLIEGLLRLSRAGKTRDEVTLVDVSALLRESTSDLRAHLKELGTELEIQGEMPKVLADREGLRRVFENLLNNAVKYGCAAEHPKITIGSEIVDGEVRYFVRDNGTGISQGYQKKIFGLFQRLETDKEGTGIGLAIVDRIMHAHDGRVWVESSPGEGATFWLAFNRVCDPVSA